MHKIFLSVASMIFTGFLMKSYKKLHEQPETKEEIYRRMKAEYDAHRAAARPVITKLDTIGAKQKMRDALRPSLDQCDAMAMATGRFS